MIRAVRAATRPGSRINALTRIVMVLAITLLSLVGPQMATANASGFDCKDSPRPGFANETQQSFFDPLSGSVTDHVTPPAGAKPSGYETYGWAGLSWHTYDLGCGTDLVRAPDAVADTKFGNLFLGIGQDTTAAAIWLDQQANTPGEAAAAGRTSQWNSFDQIVTAVTGSLRTAVYGPLVAMTLMIAGLVVGYRALKQNTAAVTKTIALAGAMFALGALFIGAPQKAIAFSDDTFGQLITGTQTEIFDHAPGVNGHQPRDVIIDNILIPDVQKGWFGPNYDDSKTRLWPDLRDSLAFKYEEWAKVKGDNAATEKIASGKRDNFAGKDGSVAEKLSKNDLSYQVFQGKDSHRISTGFMSMIKVGMPSMLWIAGSLLKIAALLAIRFAILLAPVWVPMVAVSGGLLERVTRALVSAYIWGVAGALVVAIYLVALINAYQTPHLDGTWRLWLMGLLALMCWKLLRPFKRISSMMRENGSPVVGRNHARGMGRKLGRIASWAGGPAQGVGESIANSAGEGEGFTQLRAQRADGTGYVLTNAPADRPEGKDFTRFRNRAAQQNRKRAQDQSTAGGTVRLDDTTTLTRLGQGGVVASSLRTKDASAEGDINAATRPKLSTTKTGPTAATGSSGGSTDAAHARDEAASPAVSRVWNGGPGSPIAATTLFRPPASPPMALRQSTPSAPPIYVPATPQRAPRTPRRALTDLGSLDGHPTSRGRVDNA